MRAACVVGNTRVCVCVRGTEGTTPLVPPPAPPPVRGSAGGGARGQRCPLTCGAPEKAGGTPEPILADATLVPWGSFVSAKRLAGGET